MNLRINGEVQHQAAPCSVAQLVERLQLAGKRLAVERNGDIVPRSVYSETWLAEGDQLEIVQAIGGG
jgi:sulfur carrier protein